MYDARVVDILLFLDKEGEGGGGNYLDMTSWTFVWAKNSFVQVISMIIITLLI